MHKEQLSRKEVFKRTGQVLKTFAVLNGVVESGVSVTALTDIAAIADQGSVSPVDREEGIKDLQVVKETVPFLALNMLLYVSGRALRDEIKPTPPSSMGKRNSF